MNHAQECQLPPNSPPASSQEFTQSGPDKSAAICFVLNLEDYTCRWMPFVEQTHR